MFEDDPFGNDLTRILFGQPENPNGPPAPALVPQNDYPQPTSTPMMQTATRPPQAGGSQDDGINIKGWQPHKRTTLGTIADIGLALFGLPIAPFKHKVDDQNMQEAMEGFTTDPLQTIQRIARLKGHEGDALKLYEQYIDDKRQQGSLDRQNRALDMRNDDYIYNLTANMMGAANEKNWKQMRELAIKRATARGMDPTEISSVIPEDFDADSIDLMRYGAVKTKDQMAQQETTAHHVATEEETAGHHRATEAQQKTNEGGRNSRQATREDRIDARQQNSLKAHPGKGQAQTTMTKYGPGLISPDGNKMVVTHQGKRFGYLRVNNRWVPVGEVKGK